MIEYICPECETSEINIEIVPKKTCNVCNQLMESVEWQSEENIVA